MPADSFRCGRGTARFKKVVVGGPVVGKLGADITGFQDGQSVHLFQDASVSTVILLRRRLNFVLSVLDGISRNGISITRSRVLSDPGRIDEQFRKARLPFSAGQTRGLWTFLSSMQKLVAGCLRWVKLISPHPLELNCMRRRSPLLVALTIGGGATSRLFVSLGLTG